MGLEVQTLFKNIHQLCPSFQTARENHRSHLLLSVLWPECAADCWPWRKIPEPWFMMRKNIIIRGAVSSQHQVTTRMQFSGRWSPGIFKSKPAASLNSVPKNCLNEDISLSHRRLNLSYKLKSESHHPDTAARSRWRWVWLAARTVYRKSPCSCTGADIWQWHTCKHS